MTKVFVHGNPETSAVWGPLLDALRGKGFDDLITLSPPGFGAPTPDGWSATPGAYVEWLAGELAGIEGPIDLVGHDWGSGHVLGLAAAHPELIRSWAVDCAGLVHPDYEWHEAAQAWQTPEVGEQVIAMMMDPPVAEKTAAYVDLGMPEPIAADLAAAADDTMGRCVLELYRAAKQPFLTELGNRLAQAEQRPSLVINAIDDPYVSSELGAVVAERLGSTVARLEGRSHWWMVKDADAPATALAAFWSSLG